MRFLVVATLFFAGPTYAEVTVDYGEVKRIISDLEILHDAGAKIGTKYQLSKLSELRRCVGDNKANRNKAKSLREEVMKLGGLSYRSTLYRAADASFSCVYCGGDRAECAEIPKALGEARKLLKANGAN